MPITYTIDAEKRFIRETWTGEVHAADVAAHWTRYLADPKVLEIRRTIVDLRAAVIKFSGLDFAGMIDEIVLPALAGKTWTTAIIVETPSEFGVARQYQVFAERYSRDAIFANALGAEQWLSSVDPLHPL